MDGVFDLPPADWATLRGLLDEGVALAPAARADWLDGLARGPQAALVPRLRGLLARAAVGAVLRDRPPAVDLGLPPEADDAAERPGATVGPYRLIRELGSGGMASVWLAERGDMLQRRQVALKLPHGAWRRAGLAERLAREREILAGLEHPHIARLYDAGVADGGRPYLALEWIDGERIDRFADRHGLDVRARVRLVVQVAQAVAHAHAQLVVHRDLKPANILVTSDGVPKLLDFGIAKLLDQGTAAETALTQAVGRALTPDYTAPEQLAGGPVGTAADQYALGVVLYELLAGVRPPRAVRSLAGGVADAALQAEPPAPSTVAHAGRRRALSGDLDTIVRTALAADPARRYGSVDRFAADLERHLAGLPVLARPIGALERLGKFVRRHRAGVASAAALTVAVVLGAGVALWQAAAAREGQQRAERALAFVASIFRDADPWQSGAERRDARQLLQVARARIDTEFAHAPLVRAELLVVLAEALVGVQDEAAAAESAEAGLSALAGRAGEGHPLALRVRLALFEAHFYRDDLAAARPPLQAVLDVVRADPQRHAALHIPAQANLALLEIDEGRIAEGERTALAVLALAAEAPGRWTMREIELWRAVALARRLRGDQAGALEAARRALDLAEQQYRAAPRHPDLLDTRSRHATALAAAGRAPEAVVTLREVVEQVAQAAGPYSRAAAVHLHRLAGAEQLAGEPAAARANAERALALLRRHNPAASPGIGAALATLAEAELALGRRLEARTRADEALAVYAATGHADAAGLARPRALRERAADPPAPAR